MDATKLDSDKETSKHFLPYQIAGIEDESSMQLTEKSVRIGWTYCDAFKNVRKRLRKAKRDYLFQSKDHVTSLEYMQTCQEFAEMYSLTKYIVSRGVEDIQVETLDERGNGTGVVQEVKMGVMKFDNKSRIMAFSSNPDALRAFGGDVGGDEFAFAKWAERLWASMSGRVTWGYDVALWSSHNGPLTLFNTFAGEARAGQGGWSYHHVDIYEAIAQGLVEKINKKSGKDMTREEFLADCKRRARLPEIFAQEYECIPQGGSANIVSWSVIEANKANIQIERAHLESEQVLALFGPYYSDGKEARAKKIIAWLKSTFSNTLGTTARYRCGFDIAASGQGDLACIWIESLEGELGVLRALFTCRTEDWDFLKTVVRYFIKNLSDCRMCGDETGLGRDICWTMQADFPQSFEGVNFGREKSDMGVALMTALTEHGMRIPKEESHQDIGADLYAITKSISGSKITFHEGKNPFNPSSHCDIAYSAMLARRSRKLSGGPFSFSSIKQQAQGNTPWSGAGKTRSKGRWAL